MAIFKNSLLPRLKKWHFIINILILINMLPSWSCAASFGDDNSDMLSTVLMGLEQLLTSSYARLIMVLSIIGVGYLWLWRGSIPAGRALSVIIGIGIVFSAGYLCSQLGIGGM